MGKEIEEESAKSTQREAHNGKLCQYKWKEGEKKKPSDVCDVVVFFFFSLLDRPSSLSISGGEGGPAWCSDELAGFRAGDASEGAIMAFDKCA